MTSTLQSDVQRAKQTRCKQGKGAEAEWTSELQGRKETSNPFRALPLQGKGILTRRRRCDVPEKSDAGFPPLLHHNRDFCLEHALTWVAPRESPLVPTDGG